MRKTDKLKATEYICTQLEESGLYAVQNCNELGVRIHEKPEVREEPQTIDIVIANALPTIADFTIRTRANQQQGIYTCPVLYKDGQTAFVRMVERNRSWRDDKSLKKYELATISSMLHLRGMEKAVLAFAGNTVVYYQPPTEDQAEQLRQYTLLPVELDYTHVDRKHSSYGFVQNRGAIDYKIPQPELVLQPGVGITLQPNFRAALIPAQKARIERNRSVDNTTRSVDYITPKEDAAVARELSKISQGAFPDLSPEEALAALQPED